MFPLKDKHLFTDASHNLICAKKEQAQSLRSGKNEYLNKICIRIGAMEITEYGNINSKKNRRKEAGEGWGSQSCEKKNR